MILIPLAFGLKALAWTWMAAHTVPGLVAASAGAYAGGEALDYHEESVEVADNSL
jgi:hypothetical protein